MITCPKCGREYGSFYDECPYCEAEWTSKAVIKHGRVRGRGELLATLVLTLALVAGGVWLAVSAVTSGGLNIGREYAVEANTPETIQVGVDVTQQEVSLAGAPESTEAPDETGGEDGEPQPSPETDGSQE